MRKETITELQGLLPVPLRNRQDTRRLAIGMKKASPLVGGWCGLCTRSDTILFPIYMRICLKCLSRIAEKGCNPRFIRKQSFMHPKMCEICNGITPSYYHINPSICRKCLYKFDPRRGKRD